MKIQILGYSGSGKSTLAGNLAKEMGLPVLYLDTVFWLPGWVMRPREEQTEILQEFLQEHPNNWVIDGNYSKNLFDERMAMADVILYLHFNRFLCLYRILKRNITYKHKSRDSMTAGCEEKIDWPFVKWAFWDSRTRKAKEKFWRVQAQYPTKFVELKTPKQAAYFLDRCQALFPEYEDTEN